MPTGSCHCGAVRFRVDAVIEELATFDRSLCTMCHAVMFKVHERTLTMGAGEEMLSLY